MGLFFAALFGHIVLADIAQMLSCCRSLPRQVMGSMVSQRPPEHFVGLGVGTRLRLDCS